MIDNKPNHCETNINEGNNQASNKEDHIVDESLATIQEKESINFNPHNYQIGNHSFKEDYIKIFKDERVKSIDKIKKQQSEAVILKNVEKVIAVRIEDANTFIIEKDKQRSSSIKENLQEGEQVYDKEKDKANSNDPNDQMSSTKSNGTHNINLDNSSRSKKSSDVSCKCLII